MDWLKPFLSWNSIKVELLMWVYTVNVKFVSQRVSLHSSEITRSRHSSEIIPKTHRQGYRQRLQKSLRRQWALCKDKSGLVYQTKGYIQNAIPYISNCWADTVAEMISPYLTPHPHQPHYLNRLPNYSIRANTHTLTKCRLPHLHTPKWNCWKVIM